MKLVIDKNTKAVIYFFDDSANVTIDDEKMGGDITAYDIKSSTHEIIENVTLNTNLELIGGLLKYESNAFSVIDQAAYDLAINHAAPISQIALEQAKAEKIAQIRQEQAQQINALAWRVERAKERELIGVAGESVIEVLTLRESIRQKGNFACLKVEELTDLQSVQGFSWMI